MMSSKALA